MDDIYLIRQALALQGLPTYETDIPYIHTILHTINQAESATAIFPNIYKEMPLTVVDKEIFQ